MDCQNAQRVLDGYVDGELDVAGILEIEDHLGDCSQCNRNFQDRRLLRASLKNDSLYFKAPAELEKSIRRSLRQAAKAEAPSRWLSWSWLRVAAPVAAAALVVLMLVPFFAGPSSDELLTQEIVASHIRSLMVNHLADVPSTDEHTVKPWFNGKLDFSPPVDDLAKQGFPLIGGRLDYLNNRPVAAVVYQRDKHFINVFVWPSNKAAKTSGSIEAQQGYNVIRWTRSAMSFCAVSDLERNQLEKFVTMLKGPTPAS
jgi:anti-sigma factor RsiW